ncbi:ABC transporter ATP-binding protein [Propionivibrio sp.]|jgi:branched-chain amino acid transport system ATP-binding protein|uniref:ABC transporter ATP-binding protein n=1 Tax=Propionivibrio sp. TaxID=2212460 RepID=UPI0039E675DF
MLTLQNVKTYYGQVKALEIEEMHVDVGEIVALIGANGAGKSTLLKTVSAQVAAREGEIRFKGERIDRLPPEKIVAKGIVQVPEGRQVFPAMTIHENLLMGAFLCEDKQLIEQNMEKVFGIFPILKKRFKNYAQTMSGGEQQMLALGRALMANPAVLMLDEPSLGIAPIIVEEIFEIIKELNKTGLSILLVEQNVPLSLEIADRGYVMERGKIVLEDTSANLLSNKEIEKAYLGI